MNDLRVLPSQSAVRKINEIVKRIRKRCVLVYIISHLKSQMPSMMGEEKKQKKLTEDLGEQFLVFGRSTTSRSETSPTSFSSRINSRCAASPTSPR